MFLLLSFCQTHYFNIPKGKKNVPNAYKVYDFYFPKMFEGSPFLYIINLLIWQLSFNLWKPLENIQ